MNVERMFRNWWANRKNRNGRTDIEALLRHWKMDVVRLPSTTDEENTDGLDPSRP